MWRQAGALIRRHPLPLLLPALFLGMLVEIPYLLKDSQYVVQDILAFLTQAFAFYLYIAYAEEVTLDAQRLEHIPLRSVLRRLLLAAPVVPLVMAASITAIALPTAASSLLVIPGLWLLTRWSLFAPAIVRERLGPLAALRRSYDLVSGHFEVVFLTAAFAVILEEVVLAVGAFLGLTITGSDTWGEWVGGTLAATLMLPLAAFATALVYGLVSQER